MLVAYLSWFLTAVASFLTGHHVPVYCGHPPGVPWTDRIQGYAVWTTDGNRNDRIYLRNCIATKRGRRFYVDVFAHEILHIEHKNWPHSRIYAHEHSYGSVVLREIRRRK